MIDLDSEPLLSFRDAAREILPKGHDGRPMHTSTIARWAFTGIRDTAGGRILLDHVKVGGRLYTSAAAIRRFTAATTRGMNSLPSADRKVSRSATVVDRALDLAGL